MVDIHAATQVESGAVLKLFRLGYILTTDPRSPQIPVYICIRQKSREQFFSSHFKGSFKGITSNSTLEKAEPLFFIQRILNAFLKYSYYFKHIKHMPIPLN